MTVNNISYQIQITVHYEAITGPTSSSTLGSAIVANAAVTHCVRLTKRIRQTTHLRGLYYCTVPIHSVQSVALWLINTGTQVRTIYCRYAATPGE